MEKKNMIMLYLSFFILAIIILTILYFVNINKTDPNNNNNSIIKEDLSAPESEKITLKLHYDFESFPELFEFKDYWNNHKLIKDISGYENNGRLLPFDRLYYPEIVQDSFKGNALRFDNNGQLDVTINNLVEPKEDFALVFYFKPLKNVRYKTSNNEILLLERDKNHPFPGEIRITIDKNLKLSPSNILPNNSYLVNQEDWNSYIINQKNLTTEYYLNGVKIANYPSIKNMNYINLKPNYMVIDELMIYNGSLTESEILQLSLE